MVADNKGWLPLHSAVASGNLHSLNDHCLKHCPEAFSTPNNDGCLPLHLCLHKNVRLAKRFPGALHTTNKEGKTPLDIAKSLDRPDIVKVLESVNAVVSNLRKRNIG
mmetsp:Transcript_19826/g.33847  ORF Transcript_19826/g.33847 Transcript_19826/m.33847 type:complete len:107 (-) Transcript_19826:775-1095(-)